jgi:tRNA G10  N-methylase Trm11
MKRYIFLLGKTPKISIFELEQFFSKPEFVEINETHCVVETDETIDQKFLNRLGGIVRISEVIDEPIETFCENYLRGNTKKVPFGVSTFNLNKNKRKEFLKFIKKSLKENGVRSRFVNKDFGNVTAAQIIQEKLITEGLDLVAIGQESSVLWGKTVAVQDIDSYSKRDYDKPFRDARMGMLPPKLAQVMVNVGSDEAEGVYDPFCGSGTALMEAKLSGFSVIGSDIDESRVSGAKKNLDWLEQQFPVENKGYDLFTHDASKPFPKQVQGNICIVTEGYLGPPQKQFPSSENQKSAFNEIHEIYQMFFQHSADVLEVGKKLVITFPFFQGKESVLYPFKKEYEKVGFEIVSPPNLLYARPGQIVGRELVVYERVK